MTSSSCVDVFWSFRSPYCYFTLDRLIGLQVEYDVRVEIRPVYPMAIRNPAFFENINKKYRNYHLLDCERVAAYLGIPYRRPNPDPIVQDMATNEIAAEQPFIRQITRLCAAAQMQGKSLAFVDKVARLLWDGRTTRWNEGSHLVDAIEAADLDATDMLSDVSNDPQSYDALIATNQMAHDASAHWGVPVMLFQNETFYGQDRMDLLAWRLQQAGLKKSTH